MRRKFYSSFKKSVQRFSVGALIAIIVNFNPISPVINGLQIEDKVGRPIFFHNIRIRFLIVWVIIEEGLATVRVIWFKSIGANLQHMWNNSCQLFNNILSA